MRQLSAEEQRVVDFDQRCQMVAGYLHQGKSVTMTEAQLKFYRVTPHQVIAELLNWVTAEEAEEVWEADRDAAYQRERDDAYYCEASRRARTYVIYCTKVQDKYKFQAKVKV